MGAMPRELVYTNDCVSVVSPEGKLFQDYYDTEKLERHLKELSAQDFASRFRDPSMSVQKIVL